MTTIDKNPINLICPRCGGFIPNNEHPGEYPGAMSRWTDRDYRLFEICSACGQSEAMIQLGAGLAGRDPGEAVHPVRGEVLWITPPEVAL